MKLMRKSILVVVCLLSVAMTLGAAWTTKRLTNTTGYSGWPDIAVDGSNVYAVWYDHSSGNNDIYFRRSTNGGSGWQTAKKLTTNAADSSYPAIAVDGSNIYAVWQDNTPGNYEIYFRKSTDGGATWLTARKVMSTTGESSYPAIAVSGSNVYVVWNDNTPGNWEIYLRRSTDGGATWQTYKRVTNSAMASTFPAVAVDGSNVHVVWEDYAPGNFEIYFTKSTNNGATWQTAKRLSITASTSYVPSVAVDGANIHVVWEDITPGVFEIFFRKSADGGATWQTTRKLTNNSNGSYSPDIAVNGSNVCVVWFNIWCDIYFKKSADSGATWQTAEMLTIGNTGCSLSPRIAVSDSNVFVIWEDDSTGNSEIYVIFSPL